MPYLAVPFLISFLVCLFFAFLHCILYLSPFCMLLVPLYFLSYLAISAFLCCLCINSHCISLYLPLKRTTESGRNVWHIISESSTDLAASVRRYNH